MVGVYHRAGLKAGAFLLQAVVTMLPTRTNRLLFPETEVAVDLTMLTVPTSIALPVGPRASKRALEDHRRTESAADAIASFNRDMAVYGFTKGQFSLVNLLRAILAHTGPADLVLSTWTAANQDVADVLAFVEEGTVTAARWLVDLSFSKRSPQLCQRLRQTFGDDCIRVGKNHAKFALIRNADWAVVVETSMNLNHNPRFEYFRVANDAPLAAFLAEIIDQIWTRQPKTLEARLPGEVAAYFNREM